jgi:hypothetical protein
MRGSHWHVTCPAPCICNCAAGMASAASNNGKPGGSNGQPPAAPPAQPTAGYKQPPKEILDIVDAPTQPALTFSPDRKLVCICTPMQAANRAACQHANI